MHASVAPVPCAVDLATVLDNALGKYNDKLEKKVTHPGTRCFQALRIHVNNELGDIQVCAVGLPLDAA